MPSSGNETSGITEMKRIKISIRTRLKRIVYLFCHVVSSMLDPFMKLNQYMGISSRVTILVYHRICNLPQEKEVEYLAVSTESFARQMELLVKMGYTTLTVREVISYLASGQRFPRRSVCISFDDGYRNNYTCAYPEMQRRGIRATFYIATGFIGTNKRFPWLKVDSDLREAELQSMDISCPLNWSEVVELEREGMEIGNHSSTHPNFAEITEIEVKKEIDSARISLSSQLKAPGNTFVCPFGIAHSDIEPIIGIIRSLGYEGSFFGRIGSVHSKSDPFDLPRISVYSSDSLSVFARKLNGSYDWLATVQPLWRKLVGS
jgi:peptidoglycan/xylan/chitin deacetylase (PgdA/CDA1 family)